ncbi:protein serine/threonine kinase, putative [Entamoeba invadens IP1]|uniref:Protein serine/threonine kinase, putative n=1 Tax=Entamoeba invadens IP1 TaxID=370355 RepID=A0A0A1UFA5_ENTIV|nr:protein serine/threonine kinase, putative [Entamoeba invadens IP1]ELP92624.1 protein serine/threonine kinase, putative [Entamoeba invadens IP1]|eukprot:XP_004259395.1 protein serine/threonine kinase, putative [Entamoeba invadens IP1]
MVGHFSFTLFLFFIFSISKGSECPDSFTGDYTLQSTKCECLNITLMDSKLIVKDSVLKSEVLQMYNSIITLLDNVSFQMTTTTLSYSTLNMQLDTYNVVGNLYFENKSSFVMKDNSICNVTGSLFLSNQSTINITNSNIIQIASNFTFDNSSILLSNNSQGKFNNITLTTSSILLLSQSTKVELINLLNVYDSLVETNETSSLSTQSSGQFYTSKLNVKDKSNFVCKLQCLFTSNSFLQLSSSMSCGSCLKLDTASEMEIIGNATVIANQIILCVNSKSKIQDNSVITTVVILMIQNSTNVFLQNDTKMTIGCNTMIIWGSNLYLHQNASFINVLLTIYTNSNIKLYDTSYLKTTDTFEIHSNSSIIMSDNSSAYVYICKISQDGHMKMYNNSIMRIPNVVKITGELMMYGHSQLLSETDITVDSSGVVELYDTSHMEGKNNIQVTNGGRITLNDYATIQSQVIQVSGSTLILTSPHVHTSVNAQTFICVNSVLQITGKSTFETQIGIFTSCTIEVENRHLSDMPLFKLSTISIVALIISSLTQFDFGVSNTAITAEESLTTSCGLYFLQNKLLLRYGKSQEIYCHLTNDNLQTPTFSESYCVNMAQNSYYITPILDNLELKFEYSKNSTTPLQAIDNTCVFGYYGVCLDLIQNIHIHLTHILSLVNCYTTLANVLITSDSGFKIPDTNCYAAYSYNGTFKCNILYSQCENGTFDSTLGKCTSCMDTYCLLCRTVSSNSCIRCIPNYILTNNNCCSIKEEKCLSSNEKCLKCEDGYTLENGGCKIPYDHCQQKNYSSQVSTKTAFKYTTDTNDLCVLCSPLVNTLNINGKCKETDSNSYSKSNYYIVSCVSGYITNGTSCVLCTTFIQNCERCTITTCEKCQSGYIITSSGKCKKAVDDSFNTIRDENGLYTDSILHCDIIVNAKCVECDNNTLTLSNAKCETTKIENCLVKTSSECLRCIEGYYYNGTTCLNCDSACSTCTSSSLTNESDSTDSTRDSLCLTCSEGSYKSDYRCYPNAELQAKCNKISVTGDGCYECKGGYYREGLDCKKCDIKCGTCNGKDQCLTCNVTNYKTADNDCLPRNTLYGCSYEVTANGCTQCSDGYFLYKENQCSQCSDFCNTCFSTSACTSCKNDSNLILLNNNCTTMSSVEKCIEVSSFKCAKCSFGYTPSDTGLECKKHLPWWLTFIIVLLLIIILITIVFLTLSLTKVITSRLHTYRVRKASRIFTMRPHTEKYYNLNGGLCISRDILNMNDYSAEIRIDEEICGSFSIGNTEKSHVNVHITTSEEDELYTLRVEPSDVVLHTKEACEFHVIFRPKCTCNIKKEIVVVSRRVKNAIEDVVNKLVVTADTVLSTRLNPHEIIEETKIGEGGFGVVYIGKYRNTIVAVKKVKFVLNTPGEIDGFENEVDMLDKFRSDYIIHFYGAVFIPSKICMVLEYAQFGSLQDIMKHRRDTPIIFIMRTKLMLDAAKGIEYLHNNGILHRDIKPDNILIVSLDEGMAVNGKLTDFGSSRNINMLMTNMTFTKGVGTPIYMAPEVLNQRKYKKPADVFSFAITMYECLSWEEAYPIKSFEYPWCIADFVTQGKRMEKPCGLDEKYYNLIERCWVQDPYMRYTVTQAKEVLEQF